MKYLYAYAIALAVFLVLDGIWLGVVARGFYAERMGGLMLDQPRWAVAGVFYALYVVGLVYFAISTGLNDASWQRAAMNGALFGFFCYLTYDATCLAVIKGFDPLVAVVDTVWGAVVSAATSAATVLILNWFGRSAG